MKPKLVPTKTPGIYAHVSSKGIKTYVYRYKEPGTRKSKQKTFKTETEAKRFKRDTETAKERGSYVDPRLGKTTLDQWWEQYPQRACWIDLTPATQSLYAEVIL